MAHRVRPYQAFVLSWKGICKPRSLTVHTRTCCFSSSSSSSSSSFSRTFPRLRQSLKQDDKTTRRQEKGGRILPMSIPCLGTCRQVLRMAMRLVQWMISRPSPSFPAAYHGAFIHKFPTSTCEVPCMIFLVVPPLHLRKLGNLGSMGLRNPIPAAKWKKQEDSQACRYLTMYYSLLINLLVTTDYWLLPDLTSLPHYWLWTSQNAVWRSQSYA